MPDVIPYEQLRGRLDTRNKGLRNKVMRLEHAVDLIEDGMSVGVGGSTMSRTPMALLWQMMRAGRRDLEISRGIVSTDGDLVIGSGMSRVVETSWYAQGILWGLSKVMRHYVETGEVDYREWSHMALGLRYRAGAQGVPFLPFRSMLGSDIERERPEAHRMTCPYTGEQLMLAPALNPDVALIHVQRCDSYGNAQIDGLQFMDLDLALAAQRVVLTTERIVSNEQIRRRPDATKIPFFCVDAVVEVPYGCAPHECFGVYEPLSDHLETYVSQVNADPVEGMRHYLDEYVYGPADWTAFLEKLGIGPLLEASEKGRAVWNV